MKFVCLIWSRKISSKIFKSFDIQSDLREEVRIRKGQTHLEEDYDEVGHGEVNEEKGHPGFDLLHTALPVREIDR